MNKSSLSERNNGINKPPAVSFLILINQMISTNCSTLPTAIQVALLNLFYRLLSAKKLYFLKAY